MSKLSQVVQRFKVVLGEDKESSPDKSMVETLELIADHSEEIKKALPKEGLSEHYRVKLAIALGLIRETSIYLSDE